VAVDTSSTLPDSWRVGLHATAMQQLLIWCADLQRGGFLSSEGTKMVKSLVVLYHHDVCDPQPNRRNSPGSTNQASRRSLQSFKIIAWYTTTA
jgi:hypothetical protein